MTADYLSRQFLDFVKQNNFEMVKEKISENPDLINSINKNQKSGLHFAIENENFGIIDFLLSQRIDISLLDDEGNTYIHYACKTKNKKLILHLLLKELEYDKVNHNNEKPGDKDLEIKMFLGKIISEYRAFNKINKENIKILEEIFKDIDNGNKGYLDIKDAINFNIYIDSNISPLVAEKDAKDFIKTAAIIDGEHVTMDEWIFSFSKLFVCDERVFNRFINDYKKKIETSGKISFN